MERIEKWYRAYSPMVYRLCLSYMKSAQEAEDVTQEIFFKLIKKQDSFRAESEEMTWIYRIAVNHCIDSLRSRKFRDGVLALPPEEFEWGDRGRDACTADKLTLEQVLADASPETRGVLFLYYFEGLTHEEIGEIMKVGRRAITKRIDKFSQDARKRFFTPCFLVLVWIFTIGSQIRNSSV